jgi:hypothetical protein
MQLAKWERRVYTLDSLRKAHNKPLHKVPRAARVLKSNSFAAAR